MKISENITIFSGAKYQEGLQEVHSKAGKNKGGTTVFAGALNDDLFQYDIFQRKKEAREKAMKVVGDVFAGDLAIDEDLQKRRELVDELEAESLDLQKKIDAVSEEQHQLAKQYGITEDSVEQQELELVRKYRNSLMKGALTPEERMQAAAIEARGLTEYQQRQLELDEAKSTYQEAFTANGQKIREENAIIRGTRQERLKHSPMVKAQKQAEDIMEAASEEIIGMVMDAAKEHIDEATEERKEEAEKIEEKREEQEAFIEKQQEKNREQEELLEEIPVEEMLQLDQIQSNVQKEVEEIVNKMKLVAEDIKGAAVNQMV